MDKVLVPSAAETPASEPAARTPRTAPVLRGDIAFLSQEAQVQRTAELMGEGALVVAVPALPREMRGRLAEHLDEHIERELGTRGAPSPYLSAWSAMPADAEARLADQLFRARTVGASGLALAMSSLAAASAAMTPEDSATLRVLVRATDQAALVILLDDADATLGAFAEPIALATMVAPRVRVQCAEPASIAVVTTVDEEQPASQVDAPSDLPAEAAAPVEEIAEVAHPAPDAAARRRATAGAVASGPGDFWRTWALALGAAKGPQSLAAFERLFVESYVPLASAIAAGVEDPRALRAYDDFRHAFERAYTDAFATFGATNRRPRLVMDAYDAASKHGRLHNARTSHVLVVDSMRWDLGILVRDAFARRAAGSASLISEGTLFAALPTTTLRQLETLARGIEALRAPAGEDLTDSLRGRSADTVRRLRVGSRELYKLDTVPAMLETLGQADLTAGLEEIAEHVAVALARHVETLPARTLLLVVGDHGFCVDRRGRLTHGGASPEEVMVPALTYLVGDLH